MKTKVITIRDDQAVWLDKNYVKLSALVQAMIDVEMKKRKATQRERKSETETRKQKDRIYKEGHEDARFEMFEENKEKKERIKEEKKKTDEEAIKLRIASFKERGL